MEKGAPRDHVDTLHLTDPVQLKDRELRKLIREAYEVGRQKHPK
jgi:hypothetical protein